MYAVVDQQQQQQLHFQRLKPPAGIAAQQAAMIPGQPLYHPALLPAMPQVEPIPSGNLPPGFDATACRSVYVGNVHPKVTDALLVELFSSIGPLEGCKLIRKEKSSYGFVDFFDHQVAAAALLTLNGRQLLGQAIKVNWAYASGQREDTTGHFSIFVGDLSPEITDASLYAAFSIYLSCSDARVMWDQRSGRSRGFGFVSFRMQLDAEAAITEMTGKWLGSRLIRCNWATKSNLGPDEELMSSENVSSSSGGEGQAADDMAADRPIGEERQHEGQAEEMQSGPQYTTVYVGNLAHEVTQTELHRQFYCIGAGVIEEVRVQRDKGFGFVRYQTHDEAASAIQQANGRVIRGKSVKCSWGSKPTPASALTSNSQGLPPPPPPPTSIGLYQSVVGPMASLAPGTLMAYHRQQLSMSQGLTSRPRSLPPLLSHSLQHTGMGCASIDHTYTQSDILVLDPAYELF
eukprot:SM000188S03808  [mRNA]  locus=s188:71901:76160:- [translate_table: standard]